MINCPSDIPIDSKVTLSGLVYAKNCKLPKCKEHCQETIFRQDQVKISENSHNTHHYSPVSNDGYYVLNEEPTPPDVFDEFNDFGLFADPIDCQNIDDHSRSIDNMSDTSTDETIVPDDDLSDVDTLDFGALKREISTDEIMLVKDWYMQDVDVSDVDVSDRKTIIPDDNLSDDDSLYFGAP